MNRGRLKISFIIIIIIAVVVSIIMTSYIICGKIRESKTDWRISSKLVNVPIPRDAKVLQSSDTHGAMGDGIYFVVFQFTADQYMEFLNILSENGSWPDLPMSYDMNKFIFGERKGSERYGGYCEDKIPRITRHGKYFFRDKSIENIPQYNGISIFDRPSKNFIFSLLDSDNKKLYLIKYDS